MSDVASVAPDWLGQPGLATPAGIPTRMLSRMGDQSLRTALNWKPPPAAEFRHDRTRAGWDQLRRLAQTGDRDALVFLTLMKSGVIARSQPRTGVYRASSGDIYVP